MYSIRSFIRKWLACEVSKKDPSLILFMPFQENLRDYTGRNKISVIQSLSPLNLYSLKTFKNRTGVIPDYNSPAMSSKFYVERANHINFIKTDKFTISFWLYFDNSLFPSGSSSNYLIGRDASSSISGGFSVNFYTFGNTASLIWAFYDNFWSNNRQYYVSLPENLINNSGNVGWHHFIINCDASNNTNIYYIDGVPYSVVTVNGYLPTDMNVVNGTQLEILELVNYGSYNLALSFLRIYNRHLNNNEVAELYKREKALFIDHKHIIRNLNLDIPFYIKAPEQLNNEIPFYTFAGTSASGEISFKIPAYGTQTSEFPFYLYSASGINNDFSFYTFAGTPNSGEFSFYLNCALTTQLQFFLQGLESTSITSAMPFNLYSTANSGMFSEFSYYLRCSGDLTGDFTFYVESPNRGYINKDFPFYINGLNYSFNSYIPFFLANSGSENSIPFYISGYGLTPGTTPFNNDFTFYLERPTADELPFFLKVPSQPASGDIPFYMLGGQTVNDNMSFMTSGQDRTNNEIRFYTHGF